jgi:phosphate transport system substrate-binding protein
LTAATALPALAADISGAGATFPYPIYAKWADAYKKDSGNGLNYQSIGSGGGIKQISARTVTFGASDMPLKPEELDKIGVIQFPTVMGGVVPVVNIEGIKSGDITLDGPTIARIFMGEIKSWDDAAIAKLNPKAKLPKQAIAVVHRSDGSGTTFIFTNYLSKVSADWKSKDGKTVSPTAETIMAAAAGADWSHAPGFYMILTDSTGPKSWPIAGATFILVPKQPKDTAATGEALKFFAWAYKNGGKMAEDLDYIPMPASVVSMIEANWKKDIKDDSGKPIF